MPSPVGHALGGVIVAWLAGGRAGIGPPPLGAKSRAELRRGLAEAALGAAEAENREPGAGNREPRTANREPGVGILVIACVVAAAAPDLDFLWGRHNMETHSVGAALIAGIAVFAVASRRFTRKTALTLAAAVALAWLSHVLFDWLGSDTTPPLGVMALWPFTSDYYFADAFVFDAISRRYWLPGFWTHNAGALLREVLLLTPLALTVAAWQRRGPWSARLLALIAAAGWALLLVRS